MNAIARALHIPRPSFWSWDHPAAWLLVGALWLIATAWARPLMLPDEGRYVGVAWEMLRSGDWLTPTLNGLPYFHKPPLFYWITAGSLAAFGSHELAARAAPLFGAAIGAASLFLFARRWTDARTARLALLALLAQPLFFVGGQFANLDMLVAGFIGATVLLLADAALRIESGLPHQRSLVAAYAAAGCGVLAKGLIGAVIPGLVLIVALLASRRLRLLVALVSIPGLLVFLLVAAPWFIAMSQRYPGFPQYFFVEQHFRRYAAGGFNNAQPFWFFAAVLGLFCLPWWPWLARLVRLAPRGASSDRATIRIWMAAWASVTVVFFSLPQSKLIGYVLPAIAPLAFLAADGFVTWQQASQRSGRWWWWGNSVVAILGLAAVVVLAMRQPHSSREIASQLGRERAAGDQVVMLEHYYFDLPFYARLAEPLKVVERWDDPEIGRRDNWKKELADAGAFAPQRAAALLIPRSGLDEALCSAGVTWVAGDPAAAERYPALKRARRIAATPEMILWRYECPQTTGESKDRHTRH
jgi:4-amino-4-deoxy-L-arabinose transferase-like glycosyltransferase